MPTKSIEKIAGIGVAKGLRIHSLGTPRFPFPTWRKLAVDNQWEHLSYVDAETRQPVKQFLSGGRLGVRFPDGKEKSLSTQVLEFSTTYKDHGHTYTANSKILHALVELNGLTVPVRLDKFDAVWITEGDYGDGI